MINISLRKLELVADLAREYNILNETGYRNVKIRVEFNELRKEGFTVERAEVKLSDKYNVSPEHIHTIVYSKKTIDD